MAISISNRLDPNVVFGDDFTGPTYPLGSINYLGVGKYVSDTAAGTTKTIVGGIETNKNVAKFAFSSSATQLYALRTYNDLYDVKVGDKVWLRYRIRAEPTLFSVSNPANATFFFNNFWTFLGITFAYNAGISGWNYVLPVVGATGISVLPQFWYQDGNFHDFIILLDRSSTQSDLNGRHIVNIMCWVDNVFGGQISVGANQILNFHEFSLSISGNTAAGDILYLSIWEIVDAYRSPNPYKIKLDPVVTSFNTYQALNSDGSFQFYDENGIPVIIRFIASAGQVLPQVKFVDFGTPSDVIPRINSGDWIDIDIDPAGSLIHRFRYGTDPTGPQTILVDIRKGSPSLISVNRNKSNPKIHTSAGNNWSLRSDRKNKDLNPLGYLVGNNRPTTTLTKGEKRLTNGN